MGSHLQLNSWRLRVMLPSKGKKEYALKMLEMQKAKQERKGK
jgi:hypothetical protein